MIGAAIEVHKLKGPGLLEEIYERCLLRELEIRDIPSTNQIPVNMDVPVGLLINVHELRLVDGISRFILPGANE